MSKDFEQSIEKAKELLLKHIHEREEALQCLSVYQGNNMYKTIEIYKKLRSFSVYVDANSFLYNEIIQGLKSDILKDNLRKSYVNDICFIYNNFSIEIPLTYSNMIEIKNQKVINKPNKENYERVWNENLYLTYIEYKENKSKETLDKYLRVKYPNYKYIVRRIAYYFRDEVEESKLIEKYEQLKQKNIDRFEVDLKAYENREKERELFLQEIKEDIQGFEEQGWKVKYINL